MTERLDAFMARANAAYYATHDPFADFTTSPEISQVFGELLGLWAAMLWQQMGEPDPVLLVEAGPGRGTLMADALRAIRMVPAFARALAVHLIETSPRLRAEQAARLPGAVLPGTVWHDDIRGVPDGPMLLLANEFLDALPIRQFVDIGTGWAERFVDDGRMTLQPSQPPAGAGGDVVECGEAAAEFVLHVARRVATEGGAALFVDYGPAESAPGDSLQALRAGRPADPLADPGSADLTAHVDFAGLARVARDAGAAVHGPVPQGMFLAELGLFQRTGILARTRPPAEASAMIEAARRLAEPAAMGRLFKAMAVTAPGLRPPGFG